MLHLFIIMILLWIIVILTIVNVRLKKEELHLTKENIQLLAEYKIFQKTVEIAISDTLSEMSPIKSCVHNCRYNCPNIDNCQECIENYFYKVIEDERYWVERGFRESD